MAIKNVNIAQVDFFTHKPLAQAIAWMTLYGAS